MHTKETIQQPAASQENKGQLTTIRRAPGIRLQPTEVALLRQAFPSLESATEPTIIFVEREFRSGYSGALVLLVSLDSAQAPVVVKLAHPHDLQREYDAYHQFVEKSAPQNTARLQGMPILASDKELGALLYTFAGGDPHLPTSSLQEYAESKGAEATISVLNRLFRVYGRHWWAINRADKFVLGEYYDHLLPVHLEMTSLEMTAGDASADSPLITLVAGEVSVVDVRRLQIGALLLLQKFTVIKTKKREGTITLSAEPPEGEASPPLRIRLLWDGEISVEPGERLASLYGTVSATRLSLLSEVAKRIMPTFLSNEEYFQIDSSVADNSSSDQYPTVTLRNPLYRLDALLDSIIEARFSTIHGDLNLNNVLIDDQTGFAWLIDFADTKVGPTLFDLQRLEVQILIKLLAPQLEPTSGTDAMGDSMSDSMSDSIGGTVEEVAIQTGQTATVLILTALHADPPSPASPVADQQELYTLLVGIRRLARQYLMDDLDWDEYYLGLVVALVGSLKFDELDNQARRVALTAAATVKGLLGVALFPAFQLPSETSVSPGSPWPTNPSGAEPMPPAQLSLEMRSVPTVDGYQQSPHHKPFPTSSPEAGSPSRTYAQQPAVLPSRRPSQGQQQAASGVAEVDSFRTQSLPRQATPFIGRQEMLLQLQGQLADDQCRLLSLTGPGGIGKTRLAVEIARREATAYADGVFFVPLAGLESAEQVVFSLAEVLNLPFGHFGTPHGQLIANLQEKNILVVLDNFEHVRGASHWIPELLPQAPQVKLLVTSRERLQLQGEWVFTVPAMQIPTQEESLQYERFTNSDAVQLFMASAQRANAQFQPVAADHPHIGKICRLLGGLPLAIEMAAGWVALLTCGEIVAEIEESLDILTTTVDNIAERQRSIRAVFDYSWQQLSESEKRLLIRLSVFREGFDRNAAKEVTLAGLPQLLLLSNRSLLQHTSSGQTTRYRLHPLIQRYANERLTQEPAEMEGVLTRHAEFYLSFLAGRDLLSGENQVKNVEQIGLEIDNVRAAWCWAAEQQMVEPLQRASHAMHGYCTRNSRYREGYELFSYAIEQIQADFLGGVISSLSQSPFAKGALATLLGRKAWFCFRLGYLEEGKACTEEALFLLEEVTDGVPADEAFTLYLSGNMDWYLGNYTSAEQTLLRSKEIAEAHEILPIVAFVLITLGTLYTTQGNHQAAKVHFEQAESVCRLVKDDRGLAIISGQRSQVEEEPAMAKQLLKDARMIEQRLGDPLLTVLLLDLQAELALRLEEYLEAERLYRQCMDVATNMGAQEQIADNLSQRWFLARSHNGLGEIMRIRKEYDAAYQHFQQALRQSWGMKTVPIILDTLAGIGILKKDCHIPMITSDQSMHTTYILGIVREHPAVHHQTRRRVERHLGEDALEQSPGYADQSYAGPIDIQKKIFQLSPELVEGRLENLFLKDYICLDVSVLNQQVEDLVKQFL
ncbi:MAG: tetratricopeptide repeat protein [Chloroflexota bacterium]